MCHHCMTRLQPTRRDVMRRFAFAGAVAATLPLGRIARAAAADTARLDLPSPGPQDVCPVCGMFVAPYPYWIATILYKDGKAVHFDGAKDFFKYLLAMAKYAPGRTQTDIKTMGVTGYYTAERIDALTAYYVVGSDVLGPMGHELVPLENENDAKEFVADHRGLRTLRFADITAALLERLDAGKFD